MSKDIMVLTPNGRRQKVHCTPDTSILQILEDVCAKQGFQAGEYDLKHHNHVLDLTTTIRFSNLPNKAMLEMVETDRKREETNITIGLLLEDGERRTAEFAPNTSLYDLVTSLAPNELNSLLQPTILYMRQEVIGEPALKGKTLRQLGLIGGRAILRLLNKAEETKQANVSAVYRRSTPSKQESIEVTGGQIQPGPSNIDKGPKSYDPIKLIKEEKQKSIEISHKQSNEVETKEPPMPERPSIEKPVEIGKTKSTELSSKSSTTLMNQQLMLERRLKIEEEVTFLGAQKAVAFMQPDSVEEEIEDLPDDFYDLTIEEVRKLYMDLQQHRLEIENTPLLTAEQKEEIDKQTSLQKLSGYKNVVVRIQFPDRIILQGIFYPTNTIEDVTNFIKNHLTNPEKPFHIFTTPLKESLDPKKTLLEAKFVPCVHMHFKWLGDYDGMPSLKEEVYENKTSSDAAGILASKYRSPSRRKLDESSATDSYKSTPGSSAAKSGKVPKWFKN